MVRDRAKVEMVRDWVSWLGSMESSGSSGSKLSTSSELRRGVIAAAVQIGHVASKCKVKVPFETTGVIVNRGRPPWSLEPVTGTLSKPPLFPAPTTAGEPGSTQVAMAKASVMVSLSALPEPLVPQSIPSDSTIPPDFIVKHGETEGMASSSSSLNVGAVILGSSMDGYHSADTSSTFPEEAREEGEFTPVLSKKTKKKSKISAKVLTKPAYCTHSSGLVPLLKSARHKRFK
ncbi:hypothetical protein M0R45_009390 [Rubus argutus]|uniref:Uncharacterized protein n=1 Tax=Rubus argutus TaxID=59490 RepID=A0AAW1Y4B6_RUBAR